MIELAAIFAVFVLVMGWNKFSDMDRRDRLAAKYDLKYRSINDPVFGLMVVIASAVFALIYLGS